MKLKLIIFIISIILSISAVSASEIDNMTLSTSQDIYVDSLNGDDFNDALTNNTPVKSFKKALSIAKDNDTIYLSDGNYSGGGNSEISINKSINVIGSTNTTFDGLNKNYIFTVLDNTHVVFKNIKFINAYKSQLSYSFNYDYSVYGASVEIKNAFVVIDNCSFENSILNYGTFNKYNYGGAISNFGNLTINNSTFINNIAKSTSGLYSYGGAIYNGAKLYINNSIIIKSLSNDFGYGGGIANDGDLIINNSIIKDSKASQECRGSAIYNTGNLILTNSIIENNSISRANFQFIFGAIYNSGNFTAYSNIFKNNTAIYEMPNKGSPTIYNIGNINLTYNIFTGNRPFEGVSKDVYIGGGNIISLDNNWWDGNDDPYITNSINLDGKVTSQLILNITPDYSTLNINESVDIAVLWISNNLIPNFDLIPIVDIKINDLTFKLSKNISYKFNNTQNKGLYNLTVDLYGFHQNIMVDIGKLGSYMEIWINDNISYLDDLNINITVKDINNTLLDGVILIKIQGNVYNITLNNGKANYVISNLTPGCHDLKISYEGSDDYFKVFNSTEVYVNKCKVNITLQIPEAYVDKNAYLYVNLKPQGSQSQAILYVNNVRKKIVYLYGGNTSIYLNNFDSGEYNITLEYMENSYFTSDNISGILKIKKYTTNLNITSQDIKVGENATITVSIHPDELSGEAVLIINNVNYTIFLENKETNITLYNLKSGTYNVRVIYAGDSKYYSSNASSVFSVLKTPSALNVEIIQDDKTLKGNIIVKTNSANCTGLIGVYINYKLYTLNLTHGVANFHVDYYNGTNYIFVFYGGDDYWADSTWNTTIGVADKFIFIGDDGEGYEYNNFTYKARLIEINGVPMPSRNVTIEFENNFYDVISDDDGEIHFNLNLKEGNYTIKATYKNQTIENNLTVKRIDFNLISTNIIFLENERVNAIFDENVRGKFNFILNNNLSIIVDIINGVAEYNFTTLEAGNYTIKGYYTNEYFNSTIKTSNFEVKKANSTLLLVIDDIIAGENGNITVITSVNAKGNITFILDNDNYIKCIENDKSYITLNNISGGNHTIEINYLGDNNYNGFYINTSFYIKSLRSEIILMLENITYGQTLTITAFLCENASGNVVFKVNNQSYIRKINNSKAILNLDYINAGDYTVFAVYNGNDYFIDSTNSSDFTVFKANSTINITCNAYIGENILIYAILSPNATGNVSFSMVDYYTSRNKEIYNSMALWYISPLDTGIYTVKAQYLGDTNYYGSNITYLINISQYKSILTIEINDTTINERVIADIYLTDINGVGITDKINLVVNSRNYTLNVVNGTSSIIFGKLPIGNYTYNAYYRGNDKFSQASAEGLFKVDNQLEVELISKNITKYYSGSEKLVVYLKDSSGNPISSQTINIKINNTQYNLISDSDGKVSLNINLNPGNYKAIVTYKGCDKYLSKSINVTINVLTTVEGINLVKIFKSSLQYLVIFLDSNGKALSNVNVTFRIGNKLFTTITFVNGISRININLNPGYYKITTINPKTRQKNSNSIFIFNKLMKNKDLTQYYGAGKYYKIRAYKNNGKIAIGDVVTFKLDGKTYLVKTDKNGYAVIKISLKPRTYTITATYDSFTVKNKITVKSLLITKNIVKNYGKTAKFKVKVLKSNGKLFAKQKVKVKFKGKTYIIKTNSNGIASLRISKKLGVGKYKIKTTYNHLSISNMITVKKCKFV